MHIKQPRLPEQPIKREASMVRYLEWQDKIKTFILCSLYSSSSVGERVCVCGLSVTSFKYIAPKQIETRVCNFVDIKIRILLSFAFRFHVNGTAAPSTPTSVLSGLLFTKHNTVV